MLIRRNSLKISLWDRTQSKSSRICVIRLLNDAVNIALNYALSAAYEIQLEKAVFSGY